MMVVVFKSIQTYVKEEDLQVKIEAIKLTEKEYLKVKEECLNAKNLE